jgi:hypothetical protein
MRLDGCAYFRVEVGEDAQTAGTAAQQDGQHPGPGAYALLLVSRISKANTIFKHESNDTICVLYMYMYLCGAYDILPS